MQTGKIQPDDDDLAETVLRARQATAGRSAAVPLLRRAWAMPDRWTFRIRPIAELIERYVRSGAGWADPFAGLSQFAEFRNDLDPLTPQLSHLDALEFAKTLPSGLAGVLMDPPYTKHQIRECYQAVSRRPTALDFTDRFYTRVQDVLAPRIRPGGFVISLGYNSAGFGRVRGFYEVEVLTVVHGMRHYATQVVVEQKPEVRPLGEGWED